MQTIPGPPGGVSPIIRSKMELGIALLDPNSITIGWRVRKDDGDIGELADSIQRLGQLQPIVVRMENGAPTVIAGLRRLRACRALGIKVKATIINPRDEVSALSVQLEENAKRKNFDKLEVGEGLQRFKELYEAKYGNAHGWVLEAAPRNATGQSRGDLVTPRAERFTLEVSRIMGLSQRTIYDLLSVAALPEEDKEEINKAQTAKERNAAASRALAKARNKKKIKKLEESAEKKERARLRKERAAAAFKGTSPPTSAVHNVVLFDEDYTVVVPRLLSDGVRVDLVMTSPVYSEKDFNTDVLSCEPVTWIREVAPLLDQTGTLIAFAPYELLGLCRVACIRAGLKYRGAVIWRATNLMDIKGRNEYISVCEAFFWATASDRYTFHPWREDDMPVAYLEGPQCQGAEKLKHPSQKPLWLISRLLQRHTVKGQRVFDPFAGVGTVLVSAKENGRVCIGCEPDSMYAVQAHTRLRAV